jgi:hypothetical protein
LRERILTTVPGDVGIVQSPALPNVWGVLMELGYPQAIVTLVALADGTTSLYFSNGGGILGSGEHPPVAQASKALVAMAERYIEDMLPCTTCLLPTIGRVRFHVLTFAGTFTAEADEKTIQMGGRELSPLYISAQAVLTRVREKTAEERT